MSQFQNCKVIGSQVDPDEYHKQADGITRGDPRYVMSRSELMRFSANPAEWIPYEEKQSDALDFGSFVDCLLLDKARVKEKFAFRPATYYNEKAGEDKPWSGNATVCKEWAAEHEDFQIVTAEEKEDAELLMTALLKDKLVAAVLEGAQFQVMVTGEWHDKETKLVIPYKTLIDIVPSKDGPERNCLADYKTSRHIEPRLWNKIVHEHHYEAQAWQNLELWNAATGEPRDTFKHVISKNTHPFTVARRLLTSENVEVGRLKIGNALRLYCQCLKQQSWPGFEELAFLYAPEEKVFDGWLTASPATWLISKLQEQSWTPATPETQQTPSSDDDITP